MYKQILIEQTCTTFTTRFPTLFNFLTYFTPGTTKDPSANSYSVFIPNCIMAVEELICCYYPINIKKIYEIIF